MQSVLSCPEVSNEYDDDETCSLQQHRRRRWWWHYDDDTDDKCTCNRKIKKMIIWYFKYFLKKVATNEESSPEEAVPLDPGSEHAGEWLVDGCHGNRHGADAAWIWLDGCCAERGRRRRRRTPNYVDIVCIKKLVSFPQKKFLPSVFIIEILNNKKNTLENRLEEQKKGSWKL